MTDTFFAFHQANFPLLQPSISKPISNASAPPKPDSTKLGRAASISDEFDDDFDALPDENDYDTWFQPSQEAPPTFVSFVRPSLNPSKGNAKIIQPSEAAMQAAKKLFAEVEKEEEKERLKRQLGESTTPTLTNKPTKPLESSQFSKQAADTKATVVPALTSAVTRIATTSAVQPTPTPSKPRIVNLPNTVTPRRDFQYHPSHPASKQPPQRAESPSVTPVTTFTTPLRNNIQAQVPLSTPQPTKRLGMRARGPRKSKFETPWKQGPTVNATPGPSTSTSAPSTSTSHLKQVTPQKLHSSNPFRAVEQSPQITKPKRKSLLPYSVFDISMCCTSWPGHSPYSYFCTCRSSSKSTTAHRFTPSTKATSNERARSNGNVSDTNIRAIQNIHYC